MLPQSQMGLSSSYQNDLGLSTREEDKVPPPTPECIKVLRLPDSIGGQNQITSIGYGPYDNGYLLLGTTSGHLLVFDPLNLDRISTQLMFDSNNILDENRNAITQITFDPTQTVFVGNKSGILKAVNIVKQEMKYIYLDLGQREYCTIALNKSQN